MKDINKEKSEIKDLNAGRTKTERFTRVVGYIRPLSCVNVGKMAEISDRKLFKIMK